jgi:hypothetical protein
VFRSVVIARRNEIFMGMKMFVSLIHNFPLLVAVPYGYEKIAQGQLQIQFSEWERQLQFRKLARIKY